MSESNTEEHSAKPVIMSGKIRAPINKRTWLFGIALVIVLLIIGLVIYKSVNKNTITATSNVCATDSTGSILKQAASAIKQVNTGELQQSIDQIQKLYNYQKDPNCLYPIVTYYIDAGDSQQATAYLKKLNLVYDSKAGFSKLLGPNTKSPKDLSAEISFIQLSAQESQENEKALSIP